MVYLYTQNEASPTHPIGGKARALSILSRAGAPMPCWLVITPDAFYDSLTPHQSASLNHLESPEECLGILDQFEWKPEIRQSLENALAGYFKPHQRVAVRSSALDEDGMKASFAGQLQSFLFVSMD